VDATTKIAKKKPLLEDKWYVADIAQKDKNKAKPVHIGNPNTYDWLKCVAYDPRDEIDGYEAVWIDGTRLKELDTLEALARIGRASIVGNKMHKAFPLPVIKFPLAEEVPTASEESSHCQKKRDATTKRIALLGKCSMITPRF
nr:hypothetical protein [Tanacetum cinerariifolium]